MLLVGLLLCIFSLNGLDRDTNVMRILRQREIGALTSREVKARAELALRRQEIVEQLRKANDTFIFYENVPEECIPKEGASYEHNELMIIIPRALADKSVEFKNSLLYEILRNRVDSRTRFGVVALIHAGVDVNLQIQTSAMGWRAIHCVEDDYYFAKALLSRGADPNARYRRLGASCWVTPLKLAESVDMAKILIEHGARVDLPENKDLLYEVVQESQHTPELLELYIKNGLCVNGLRKGGQTVLDCLISCYRRYDVPYAQEEDFLKKMLILLNHGDQVSNPADKKYRELYKMAIDYRAYQEETARLRDIDI